MNMTPLNLSIETWKALGNTKFGKAMKIYYKNLYTNPQDKAEKLVHAMGNEAIDFADMFIHWKDDMREAFDIASEDEIERLKRAMEEMSEVVRDYSNQLADYQPEEEIDLQPVYAAAAPIGTAAMDRINQKGKIDARNRDINSNNKARLESLTGKVKAAENDYHNKAKAYEQAADRRDKFDRDPVGYMMKD